MAKKVNFIGMLVFAIIFTLSLKHYSPTQLSGVCYLPTMEGPERCQRFEVRYHYDYNTQNCGPFYWRGCNGNKNNFADFDECLARCLGVTAPSQNLIDATTPPRTRPSMTYPTRRPDDRTRPPHQHSTTRRPSGTF